MQNILGRTVYIFRTERGGGKKIPQFCGRHTWKPPHNNAQKRILQLSHSQCG